MIIPKKPRQKERLNMAKYKIWYEIWGIGQYDGPILLAKVKSKGTSFLVADALSKAGYKNVTIK
jgi:hypothetical protein